METPSRMKPRKRPTYRHMTAVRHLILDENRDKWIAEWKEDFILLQRTNRTQAAAVAHLWVRRALRGQPDQWLEPTLEELQGQGPGALLNTALQALRSALTNKHYVLEVALGRLDHAAVILQDARALFDHVGIPVPGAVTDAQGLIKSAFDETASTYDIDVAAPADPPETSS